jgi:hypothetical protein
MQTKTFFTRLPTTRPCAPCPSSRRSSTASALAPGWCSAAAITTSFLGAQALEGGDSQWTAWLALATFVGVAIMSLAMLWPRHWEFTASPRDLIQTYIESGEPAPIEELHRDLSLHMHNSYVENRKGLEQLAAFFQVAIGLLATEVVLWIVAIASTP